MRMTERKNVYIDAIERITAILATKNGHKPVLVYKALLEAFPEQIPPYQQFEVAFKVDQTARQLLRALYPRKTVPELSLRSPVPNNMKFGTRKDPLEVRYPEHKASDWRDSYQDPTCILLDSLGNKNICDQNDLDTLARYKISGNMLYVLEAFFRRVDQMTGGLSEARIKSAKPEENDYVINDGGGLALLVKADGSKEWLLEIAFKVKSRKSKATVPGWHCELYEKKRRSKRIGLYPEMSLDHARRYREAANRLLAERKNPFSRKNGIEALVENIPEDDKDIPVPAWMAKALAEGFKYYYSRRILSGKRDYTLDAAFGIESNKYLKEIDSSTIDNTALVDEARSIQWFCKLKFKPALMLALKKLKLESIEYSSNSSGQGYFKFSHAEVGTICQDESRGGYGSLGAWHTDRGHSSRAPTASIDHFFSRIEQLDSNCKSSLKSEIEAAMKDKKKQLKSFPQKTPRR